MVLFIWKPQVVLNKLNIRPDVNSLTNCDLSGGGIVFPPELAAGGHIESAEVCGAQKRREQSFPVKQRHINSRFRVQSSRMNGNLWLGIAKKKEVNV